MFAFFSDMNTAGKIGLIIGLLGALVGAIAAIIAAPIAGAIVVVVFAVVFVVAFKATFGPYGQQKALLKSGSPAEGTILEVRDTGVTVNGIYPMIKVRLEVRPPGSQPYQAETKMLISRLQIPQFQPGTVVPVMYDPKNPKKVAIGGLAGASSSDRAAAQDPERTRMAAEFLAKEDKKNEEIRAAGRPAKAKIITATPLGINVNGNNPAMTFILEVQPEREPSFQAQTTGVIGEAAAAKYQPGREIWVKYDANDKSRVSLDHS